MAVPRSLVAIPPKQQIPLGELLTWQARRDPNRPALTFEGVTYTRGALDARANRLARALAAHGVGEDDVVTIALPNSVDYHVTAFAIWKLGATPQPVSYRLPDIELKAILELAQPKLVIGVGAERAAGFPVLPQGFQPDPSLSDAPLPPKAAKRFKAMNSGGSTGRPKLILDRRPAFADPEATSLGMETDDVILNSAPLYHNAPFCFTAWCILWGGHLIETTRFDPEQTLRLIEAHKVKWVYLVPTMMNRIWALGEETRNRYDLSSLELVMHMAAMCPDWLKAAFIDWLGPDRIGEIYAGTESLGGTAIMGFEWLKHRGSVGKPSAGAQIRVLDDQGQDMPTGEVGEIYFRPAAGRSANYDYVGAARRVIGEWESYGDMGSLDEDGYLYLSDRRTDMVISGGANIFPAEIEGALEAHPGVGGAVVVGLPDADLGQRVHAIVHPRTPDAPPLAGDLMTFLSERLARYKLPYTYELVAEPLRDEAGKVRRSALRDDRARRAEAGETFLSMRG